MEDSLARSLDLPAGSRVLDAGCGYGHVAIHLARKHGLLVTGIDVVDRHIARARRNVAVAGMHERISIENMDYHHLENIPSGSLDGVYTMETFVHATDPSIVLDGFFRVLKPGGSLALYEYDHVTPTDVSGELARNFDLVNTYAAMPANTLFERGTLPLYLENAGFVEVEVRDLSENMKPMLRLFFMVAYIPFLIIRCCGLEAYFINTVAAVVGYQYLDHHRYVAVTARKPWRADTQAVRQRK
jgi:ubiquinone/menaquinone biosynthesis C-methylase UbiE